jgi:DNA invertase Pin-like site-specific DNA recombinase
MMGEVAHRAIQLVFFRNPMCTGDIKMPNKVSAHPLPNGQPQRVLVVCRASWSASTTADEQLELQEQQLHVRDWLEQNFDGPFVVNVVDLGSNPKGTNSALNRTMDALESGAFVLVFQCLRRLSRNWLSVFRLLQAAAESGTRVVAIDEGLDTSSADWRIRAAFSGFIHGLSCAEIPR